MPDVAIHAGHARMGGCEVGRVFGLHHGVTQGAAKGDGLAVQKRVVRDKSHEDGKERSPEGDVDEPLAVSRNVQVDEGIREGVFASNTASAKAFSQHPVQKDDRPHGEERREHHVGEDADVGTVPIDAELEREREDDEEDAPARDERPEETDRVPIQAAASRGFFFRHAAVPLSKQGFSPEDYKFAGVLGRETLSPS